MSGLWNDEFRASYRAALDMPNLSDDDRWLLIADAMDRAKKANAAIKAKAIMRRLLYEEGYE